MLKKNYAHYATSNQYFVPFSGLILNKIVMKSCSNLTARLTQFVTVMMQPVIQPGLTTIPVRLSCTKEKLQQGTLIMMWQVF